MIIRVSEEKVDRLLRQKVTDLFEDLLVRIFLLREVVIEGAVEPLPEAIVIGENVYASTEEVKSLLDFVMVAMKFRFELL